MKNVFYLIVPQTTGNHSTGLKKKNFKNLNPPKKGKNNLLVKKKKNSFCLYSFYYSRGSKDIQSKTKLN